MSIESLIARAKQGEVPPVCLIGGSERFWSERAIGALRTAVLQGGVPGFNDDLFQGQGLAAQSVIAAARTMPMMARKRFVLVRNLEAMASHEQELLADYLRRPSPDACVALVGEKIDGRTKLAKTARELGVWYEAETPKAGQLPALAQREASARGHRLDDAAAAALVDALGADLSALDDALERLSLFVGDGRPIQLTDVERCISHARTESVWLLVDAVAARDARVALTAAASLLGDREPPLRILALVARQLRTLAKMRSALAAGLRPQEAAQQAGAPPFKARDLAALCRSFDDAQLARSFDVLAATDLALKSSRVPGPRVLERALLALCS